jgi:hypothetical protein
VFTQGMTLPDALAWYNDLCAAQRALTHPPAIEQNEWDREDLANRIEELGGTVPAVPELGVAAERAGSFG